MKKFLLFLSLPFLSVVIFTFLSHFAAPYVAAQTTSVSILVSPQTGSVVQNGTIDVALAVDGKDKAITGVDIEFLFNSAVLEVMSYIPPSSSTSYPNVLSPTKQESDTAGVFRLQAIANINNGQIPDIKGNNIPLGTLRLKAIGAANASSSLTVKSSTAIVIGKFDESYTTSGNQSGNYMVTSSSTGGGTNGSLSFSLLLHGIGISGDSQNPTSGGNKNPVNTQRNITVQVYNLSGSLLTEKTVSNGLTFTPMDSTTKPPGKFTGNVALDSPLASGDYILKVKTDRYLVRRIPKNGIIHYTATAPNTIPEATLVVGDSNGDNKLDMLDYTILLGCYSDFSPPASCTAIQKKMADLNDDGKVNQVDYNLFVRELSIQTGD